MKRKNDCGLLPFTREDIYGLDPKSAQIIGWEISKFNINSLWDYTQGEGVITAVIDTGCDINHIDLKDNIIDSINLINNTKDPIDDNGHGTHVCGTIAASNNGYGMVGVAPKSKILPIKALNSQGSGNNITIAKAIKIATDKKCDFITMSLGSPYKSKELEDAIKYANSKNTIIFCAAGNSGPSTPIMYPAKFDKTVAIGSVDRNLKRSNFTCKGKELDFLSPGENIFSCVPNNSYAVMSGTSMANPFAVGCAVLLLSYAKKIGKQHKLSSYDDYINILKQSVDHLTDKKHKNNKEYEGYGVLLPPNLNNI